MAKKNGVSGFMLETNLARTQGKRTSSSLFSSPKRRRKPKRNLKPKDLEKIIDTTFTEEEGDGPGLFTQTGTPRYNLCMVDKGSDKQLQLRYGRAIRSCVDIENSGGGSSVQSDWNENNPLQPDFIKNKPTDLSDFNNDVGFITSAPVDSVNGHTGVVVLGKGDVGLSNVDNTSDINKPISTDTQNALNLKADVSSLSTVAISGDYNDLSNQPDLSGFDNIDFYDDLASFPAVGSSGDVLYLAKDTGILYRWSGSAYVVTSGQLAIGETSSTAYRGDRGKIAFDHTSSTNNPHNVTKGQVGLGSVPNTDFTSAVAANTSKVTNATHSGDATGDTVLTLATVNSDVGTYNNATVTVDAKGRVTAVSNGSGGGGTRGSITGTLSAQTDLQTALDDKAEKKMRIITKTADYTLVLADVNGDTLLRMNSASDTTVTIPTNATVNSPVGIELLIENIGTGKVTIAGAGGVTMEGDVVLMNKDDTRGLIQTSLDIWKSYGGSSIVPGENNIGYLNIPQNSRSANYTLVLGDAGKSIDHPSSDANTRTFTIPSNASVAYPIGTTISFSNMTSQVVTIAITTDTMYLAGDGATGSRTLAQYGVATIRKLTATTRLISGIGLT